MIPDKDRNPSHVGPVPSDPSFEHQDAASAQTANTPLSAAQNPSLASSFHVDRTREWATEQDQRADLALSKALRLSEDPSSSKLAQAASHLEAARENTLATYWHREAAALDGPDKPKHLDLAVMRGQMAEDSMQRWATPFEQLSETSEAAVRAIAKAVYSSSWADAMEEAGYSFPPRTRIDHVAPEPTTEALQLAIRDAQKLCDANKAPNLDALLERLNAEENRTGIDSQMAQEFGFKTGLQLLGHGVSYCDDHPVHLVVPHSEFYVSKEEAISRWMRPGSYEPFAGYLALDLDDAQTRKQAEGGYLLKAGPENFVVANFEQAVAAWDRDPDHLSEISNQDFSEVGP